MRFGHVLEFGAVAEWALVCHDLEALRGVVPGRVDGPVPALPAQDGHCVDVPEEVIAFRDLRGHLISTILLVPQLLFQSFVDIYLQLLYGQCFKICTRNSNFSCSLFGTWIFICLLPLLV